MIEAILWDNDGVLVETEHLYFEATRQVMSSAGVALTLEQYLEFFLRQGKGAWHLLEEQGVPPNEIETLRSERNALYARLLSAGPRLVTGIDSVLDALHGRYVMGVVTSSRRDHFDVIHRSTGLLRYFDFVVTSDDCRQVKPDPEPYLRAVERSGVAADSCVAIEDSERGLEAAHRAGVRCIVVPSVLTRGCGFSDAHCVLESVSDIPRLLKTMTAPLAGAD